MGEILFLAHRPPFAPDRGDTIRSYHLLRRLSELATVHVGAFSDSAATLDGHPRKGGNRFPTPSTSALRRMDSRFRGNDGREAGWGDETCVVPRPPRIASAWRGLIHRRPLSVAAFDSHAMHAFVARILADRPIDTIFAFSGQMAQFVPAGFTGRFLMDFVDVDSAKFAAYAANERGPRRWLHAREARLLDRFEGSTARRAALSLFVSDAETALFRARHRDVRAATLGNGIDIGHYDPGTAPVDAGQGPLILFTGQMDYRPNVEAVIGFARDVLPLVRARLPAARFAIVGRDPSPAVARLAGGGVIVTGEVADVRPWLARADVVVAPLKLARGIQNKVLEAMAMARPAVVSPAAFEGIDAVAGRDLIVADAPAAQADGIVALLRDPLRAVALGRAARARVEARYGWDAVLAPLAGMAGRDSAPLGIRAAR